MSIVPVLPSRSLRFSSKELRPSSRLEWLVTNGLGGYASGTLAGGLTRRFHGLLIAALPAPYGRMMYVGQLRASVAFGGDEFVIDHEDLARLEQPDVMRLTEFRLDGGLPVWRYQAGREFIEKRVVMLHRSNTTIVRYTLDGTRPCVLRLTPLIQVRPHEAESPVVRPDTMRLSEREGIWHLDIDGHVPPLEWALHGDVKRADFSTPLDASLSYAIEEERGYAHAGVLWYPGTVDIEIPSGGSADFVMSAEAPGTVAAVVPEHEFQREEERRREIVRRLGVRGADPTLADLALAADQFLIVPIARQRDVAEVESEGDRPCSVIAGYHWFTDWGRDTMISLEGLTLCTGRTREAAGILRVFAKHVQHGLVPNFFPEGEQQGLYHTADATLWFIHAISRYVRYTGDRQLLVDLLPVVADILEHHLMGTRFGIGVDPSDGLLKQGAPHYQLTWMDAKVGDWVVTPRRGKAVEINALWYNALKLAEDWMRVSGDSASADRYGAASAAALTSFNRRFWNPLTECLFDVVDGEHGDDPACRPNQLLAISLEYPVLAREHWDAVVRKAQEMLLTPVGLRSLSPDHRDYQRRYYGNLHARDAAYHQGTVWAWLIGPYVDAWLRVHPDDTAGVRALLLKLTPHLDDACIGSISEIFDAEEPFTPRGCIAQAWSVAEALRCLWLSSGRPFQAPEPTLSLSER